MFGAAHTLFIMARKLRVEDPGAIGRVMSRGDRREPISKDYLEGAKHAARLRSETLVPLGGTAARLRVGCLANANARLYRRRQRGKQPIIRTDPSVVKPFKQPRVRMAVLAALLASAGAIAGIAASAPNAASSSWHQALCLANDGYWRQRVHVVVQNHTDRALEGEPVDLNVGPGEGQAALEGASAEALRVVNAAGAEMLWVVTAPDGRAIRRGPIPAGSTLTLPGECPPRGQASYFVYFDNPAAWAVPDFLEAAGGLRNGGFEEGTDDTPAGWAHDAADAQHRAVWVAENPRSGKRCLKTVVTAGAEATWISTRQSHLRILGGARYVMRGWVRALDVKGWAGWYIHVGNATNFMLLNPMLNGGGGTYDWKEVKTEFTAPVGANLADLGTVLRGTGTAWFDDVSLERLDSPGIGVTAQAFPPERLEAVRDLGLDAPWPAATDREGWAFRVPVTVWDLGPLTPALPPGGEEGARRAARRASPSGQSSPRALIAADLSGVLGRLHNRADSQVVRVMSGPQPIPSYRLGKLVLFEGQVEPRTRRTFHVYFRVRAGASKPSETGPREYAPNPALPRGQTQEAASSLAREDFARLLERTGNLVKNPSFELGDKLPEHWAGGAEAERPKGARMGFAEPGLFGRRCVTMTFPTNAQPQWTGWRQDVPVQPGRTYLFAAWLKCQDLAGGLQLHAHFRNARGGLCRDQQMTGAGPALHGTTDWTLLDGLFTMPPDIATFQLHLTMLARGTAWHDGVVLTEVTLARPGQPEARAATTLAAPTAWPVNAVVKVFQDDLPPAAPPPARITAARNDYEPLQIALRSPKAVPGVRVTVEAPANNRGQRLTNVTVGVVGYVPVDHPTSYYNSTTPTWHRKLPAAPGSSDGWPGWWPDPILPRDTFDLAAHRTQPVWVTIHVPKDAAAGDYFGRVRFTAAGATLAEVPFLLQVWDFTLPDEMHLKAIYDCRQHGAQWAVPGKTPEQARRDFWRFMAERRLCPDTIHPAPSLRFEKDKVVADFAAFDAAAEFYFDELRLPHAYTPWVFYCFGWGHPPGAKFGEQPYEGKPPFEDADRSQLRPQFKRAYQACLRTFWNHLKARGWDRKVVLYISDEPFDAQKPIREQMKALCAMIHEVDPAIPIYCSTWHHQPDWDGHLDVWGLGHYGIVPVEKLRHIREGGARLWWTTDGQMCTDTPYCAVERLLPHYCFKYGAEAYEFWGVDWLTYDPYEFGWHRFIHQSDQPGKSYYVRYPNGDGYLAYPGAPIGHPGPVTSVRLEQAREGCEDYEYLHLLRERLAAAKNTGRAAEAAEQVLAQAQELVTIPNAGGRQSTRILPDPDAVLQAKERVARAIEGLR
jgi:hypothetical protein